MMTEVPLLKPVRSFVRRMGRMTPSQQRALDEHWPIYGLTVGEPVTSEKTFGNSNPLWLEVGFGMGEAFVACAKARPMVNVIGVEVHLPGVGKVLDELAKQALKNVRLFQEDVMQVLLESIPDRTLERVQVFFPDPWPKKKHHKRRLVAPPFLDLIAQKLQTGGIIYLSTDWEDYANWMLEQLNAHPAFENRYPETTFMLPEQIDRFHTKFEARGIKKGHGVWDLMFVAN